MPRAGLVPHVLLADLRIFHAAFGAVRVVSRRIEFEFELNPATAWAHPVQTSA